MHILASDQFEGRQPGTRGFTMASDYVQNKMKAMGLLPGAAGGSYVQPVLLKRESLHSRLLAYHRQRSPRLRPGLSLPSLFLSPPLGRDGPAGIRRLRRVPPELHYDDYGSTDVKAVS